MIRDKLIEKLKGYEWRDIEFKEAQWAVPKDVYTTVSAFANTEGGHLIFGVRKQDGGYEIIGVISVDEVQNAFLSTLRAGNKLSALVPVQESKVDDEKGTVLIFYIPEVSRKDKPIHLDGELRKSYIRRGGTDQHCSDDELRRFIRDASGKPYDTDPIPELDSQQCFDPEVINWYRRVYNEKNPGRHEKLDDLQFLAEWAFLVETDGRLVPTRASILLFGFARYVRQILPRPLVDYQRLDVPHDQWSPERRWDDRLPIEENLIQAWWLLVEKYMRLAERPFSLDVASFRRNDQPPDYISFRESAINLLIHQDFGDNRRTPTIKFFQDRIVLWNPGDAFASTEELLEPKEKEVRNPSVVAAFRRIGLSDQAGTGIRSIFRTWHALGNIPPVIRNDKTEKAFELSLLKERLMSEQQLLFQAKLGVHLSDPHAQAFALACLKGVITATDVRAVTGATGLEARAILQHLTVQALLKPLDESNAIYALADHLQGAFLAPEKTGDLSTGQVEAKPTDLSTGQVEAKPTDLSTGQSQPLTALTEVQWKIVEMTDTPRPLRYLMKAVGAGSREYFINKHLRPLLDGGVIRMTNPENPTAANQKYVLTQAGVQLKASRV